MTNFFAREEISYSDSLKEGKASERIVGFASRIQYYDREWRNPDFPYLDGLLLSREQESFYEEMIAAMSEMRGQYPDRPVYSMNSLYILKQFEDPGWHPVYTQIDGLRDYILSEKPVIIALDDRTEFLKALEYALVKTITIGYPQVIAGIEKRGTEVHIWVCK